MHHLSSGHVEYNPYTWIKVAPRHFFVQKEQLATFRPISTARNSHVVQDHLIIGVILIPILLLCYFRKPTLKWYYCFL